MNMQGFIEEITNLKYFSSLYIKAPLNKKQNLYLGCFGKKDDILLYC